MDRFSDRDFMVATLCAARPFAKPGRYLAYLRRIRWLHPGRGGPPEPPGSDIRTVLGEEILHPLGFRWTNYGVAPQNVPEVALNYLTGPPMAPPFFTCCSPGRSDSGLDELVSSSNDGGAF